MKTDEAFDHSDDGLYPTDDIYGATADFWGDSDSEQDQSTASSDPTAPPVTPTPGTDKTSL